MTTSTVFYPQIPDTFVINRNWSCRPNEPENAWKEPYLTQPATVESITKALERGPFVAISGVGPQCYANGPKPFSQRIIGHPDAVVHGWPAGSRRISNTAIPVIICGVQRKEGHEDIYYRLAEDVSENPSLAIGTIKASTDTKVYLSSLKNFAMNEVDMFPPVSAEEMERKQGESVVPTIFAGRPALIEAFGLNKK